MPAAPGPVALPALLHALGLPHIPQTPRRITAPSARQMGPDWTIDGQHLPLLAYPGRASANGSPSHLRLNLNNSWTYYIPPAPVVQTHSRHPSTDPLSPGPSGPPPQITPQRPPLGAAALHLRSHSGAKPLLQQGQPKQYQPLASGAAPAILPPHPARTPSSPDILALSLAHNHPDQHTPPLHHHRQASAPQHDPYPAAPHHHPASKHTASSDTLQRASENIQKANKTHVSPDAAAGARQNGSPAQRQAARPTDLVAGPTHGSDAAGQPRRHGTKKRKTCKRCHQNINGQFVRALNAAFHIQCFKCYTCGALCLAKFFPDEVKAADGTVEQVPLCEYDYFKKLGLICFSCDSALRGPYITALGNKYHLEHFKCSACGKVFESDESYYEHDHNIYCHFHYSRLFATKCEGCQSSIVKQFVELFKSGVNQQWHPECYMIYKFWNVTFTPDAVGLPERLVHPAHELDASELVAVELKIETTVINCWVALLGFEETSATCISEMLLAACTGKRLAGLYTTGKLIIFLEILFVALDYVQAMCQDFKPDSNITESKVALLEEVYSVDAFDKFQTLRKEPRNISGKLMSYLAILRKSNNISDSGLLSAELLLVITGCAHYLKLLIRIGLGNTAKLNKLRGDTLALDRFLLIIKSYEEVESSEKNTSDPSKSIYARLSVPPSATDACYVCLKSIEKSCVRFNNLRWHHKCFECSQCHRKASPEFKVESFLFGSDDLVICTECSKTNNQPGIGYTLGFSRVSDLSQLAYLLKIAVFRSKIAIRKDSLSKEKVLNPRMTNIDEVLPESETVYSQTLDEVTLLRKKRESQKLRNSVKKNARKSVILKAPEAAMARSDNTGSEDRPGSTRNASTTSTLSYTALHNDLDFFNILTDPVRIKEDPPARVTPNSLDRTLDLLKNEKSLTLDDIPRIVAAEQAREQRPNAFKHHNSLYQKKSQNVKAVLTMSLNLPEPARNSATDKPALKNKYFSELTKQEHRILRFIAVEALLEVNDHYLRDELLALVHAKKQTTFWDKFKFGNDKSKATQVFGLDLKILTEKYGVDSSSGVGPSQLRIPLLVDDVIHALRLKDMSVEGIFRLNGNIKNLRELAEQINAAPLKSPEFTKYSAVQLAALMKKWLRELPNPLLTFNLRDLWISSRSESDSDKRKRILHLAYCMLPRSHRDLLEVLLYFFSFVASFAEIDEESGSKMDTHNLATVIAPNILLSKASTQEGMEHQSSDAQFLAIEVVNQLIEVHEDLAVVPADLYDFYEKCQFPAAKSDLSSKEIVSRISKTLKEHPNHFAMVKS